MAKEDLILNIGRQRQKLRNKRNLPVPNIANQSMKENAMIGNVDFPVENFQTPDKDTVTSNFLSKLLPTAGDVIGDVVSRGAEVAGTGLEKLTELAKDPRTYETLANIGQVAYAYEDPYTAQALGRVAAGLGTDRRAKQEAAAKEAKLTRDLLKQEEKDKLKLEDDYRKEIEQNKIIKDTRQVNSDVSRMNKVWETYKNNPNTKSKNALDQALVITFNKMMDPGSVVRESEFARTPQGLALMARLEGLGERFKQGGIGLTDEARQEIINISEQLQSGQIDEANRLLSTYEELATQRNLNTKNIFKYFKNPILESTKSQPTNKPQQTVTVKDNKKDPLNLGTGV